MQIWLIEDGQKEGPFLDFEIRSRIHSGELTQERKIWHSDLDGWTPLGEVDLFSHEFEEKVVTAENVNDYLAELEKEDAAGDPAVADSAQEAANKLPQPPPELHLWRRFGARWFDYTLYLLLLMLVILLTRGDIVALKADPKFAFAAILPFVFFESLSLTFWGTTPGKWLVGLKVRNASDGKLTPGHSIMRSLRVMILGMGFGQEILLLVCHAISAWLGFKKKIVLWDSPVGTQVVIDRPLPEKWVGFGVGLAVLFFSCSLLLAFLAQHVDVAALPPEQQERFEQSRDFGDLFQKAEK